MDKEVLCKTTEEDPEEEAGMACKQRLLLKRLAGMLLEWQFYLHFFMLKIVHRNSSEAFPQQATLFCSYT